MMSFSSQSAAMASLAPYYPSHHTAAAGAPGSQGSQGLPGSHNLYGAADTKLNSHLWSVTQTLTHSLQENQARIQKVQP